MEKYFFIEEEVVHKVRLILELLRIILIFFIAGGLLWVIIEGIYRSIGISEAYHWIAAIGIYLSLFVFYRNKLQFTGWYRGKGRVKLSKQATQILLIISVFIVALPLLFDFIGS